MKPPVIRRPWTDAERALALALARCRFGWANKNVARFAEGMAAAAARPDDPGITEKQAAALRRLVAAYRMQIPPDAIPESCRYLLTKAAADRLRLRTEYVLTEERKARPVVTSAIATALPPPPSPQLSLLEPSPPPAPAAQPAARPLLRLVREEP